MTVHRVFSTPRGGDYTRAKCGYVTRDPKRLVIADERPEGGCRKCWGKVSVSDKTKLNQIALILDEPELDRETIRAILEGRYTETDHKSPKAA